MITLDVLLWLLHHPKGNIIILLLIMVLSIVSSADIESVVMYMHNIDSQLHSN